MQQVSALAVSDAANPHRYQLTGLLICGACGRRLEGQWVHGRAGCRCRHGYTSGGDVRLDRAKILYLREDQVLAEADRQLANHIGFDPRTLDGGELGRQLRWRGYTLLCGDGGADPGASPS